MEKKKIFKDFINHKNFTIYEVFDNGYIRQFNKAEFSTPEGNNAALRISLGFSTNVTRYVDVWLLHSVAYGKDSAVFINREEAKEYAIKKISAIISAASKNLSNITEDKISVSDVIDLDDGKLLIFND